MKKNIAAALIFAIALGAVVTPIVFSIHFARNQSFSAEEAHLMAYARDVLHRSDSTVDQVASGFAKLKASQSRNPCSNANIATMRDIDIGSSYIQTIGYMSGNRMICSSLGRHEPGIDLGPVDMVTSNGIALRSEVRLPFVKDRTFLAIAQDRYVAIVHKSLPVDATTSEASVSLATFALDNGRILAARGLIRPEWIKELDSKKEVAFFDETHFVAVVKSDRYRIGAIAALPLTVASQRVIAPAFWIVTIGVAAGIILAVSILYLAQIYQSMPTALGRALRRNELHLQYQPIVDLKTREWVGAEALVIWRRDGKTVPPDVFIPVAESSGLIQRITARVIEIVSRDAADLFRLDPDFHIAINLSANDLHSKGTIGLLYQLKQATRAGQANLVVEATERGFLSIGSAKDIVHEIRVSGIRTSIDDFGTGYSSLSYLENLEIDFLKIDKSFVQTIGTDAPTSHVVVHIIQLAKDLNLEIIAEGVETEAQATFLRDHGVHYAQGWLFSKAISVSDLKFQIEKYSNQARPVITADE